jgi:uncharacterized protein YjdB
MIRRKHRGVCAAAKGRIDAGRLTGLRASIDENCTALLAIAWLMFVSCDGSPTAAPTQALRTPAVRIATTIAIEPAIDSIGVGDTVQLNVVVSVIVKDRYGYSMKGYKTTWQSSDPTIASVSNTGLVTGNAAGSVTITAAVSDRLAAVQLTVEPPPARVTTIVVDPANVSLGVGDTTRLVTVVKDQYGNTMHGYETTWQSSDTTIASISSAGIVTGIAAGPVVITATVSGQAATAQLAVRPPAPPVVTSLVIDPATAGLAVGETMQLVAVVKDETGATVRGHETSWQSSDTTVASVSAAGLVTGVAVGSATITATVADRSAVAQFSVLPPGQRIPTTLAIESRIATFGAGDSTQLTAVAKDQNGHTMHGQRATWQSSDTTIAFVSGSGVVTGIGSGVATITAKLADKSATVQLAVTSALTNTSAPPVATGIWIGRAELGALSSSGSSWAGDGELKQTADDAWLLQPIERQAGQVYNVQAMAGALVFARLYPDPAAESYRSKVVRAIRIVMAWPSFSGATVTAPNRFLGTWAITADLINLPAYDPVLDRRFRAWLQHKLTASYQSQKSIRQQMGHANNQGAWACFSLAAASVYLGDRATLDLLALRTRRWLGDTSVPFRLKWTDKQSWQLNPNDSSTWVGVNPKGATRDGYNFDGIQPSDQNRGTPMDYDSSDFPNSFSAVRYNETSLHGALGAVLILHRAGYTDLIDASDQALLRAARWIKYAADNYAADGYQFFTGPHEAVRPLINYLYPSANLPAERVLPQAKGRAYGYAWTFWTHSGRRVQR